MRSPSQWPGTARSSTSAGPSEINTMSLSLPSAPLRCWGLCGDGEPDRCEAHRSTSPSGRHGPAGRAPGRSSHGTPTSVAHPDVPGAVGSRSAAGSAATADDARPLGRAPDRPRADGPSACTPDVVSHAPRPPPGNGPTTVQRDLPRDRRHRTADPRAIPVKPRPDAIPRSISSRSSNDRRTPGINTLQLADHQQASNNSSAAVTG